MTILAGVVSVLLLVFTLRRYLFLAGSFLPGRAVEPDATRSIAVLVAARNETRLLPHLLAALDSLDYPARLLHFVLISDGSNDSTPKLLEDWTRRRDNAVTLHLTAHAGKSSALRTALDLAPAVELIAVLDADTVPESGVLQQLAGAFRDPATGAAGGYPEPHNANASHTARYAAIERWILHLVTLAGKDRLRMNPAAIGAVCMIRRQALIEIGGVPVGATAEDIHISVLLNRAGWTTRSVPAAVAREDVPETFAGFQAQRLRWSRGLMETRRAASGIEDVLVAAGYCDRLVLLAAVVLAWIGLVPSWLLGIYLAAPVFTIGIAVSRARSHRKWLAVLSLPFMVVADVAVTAFAMLSHLLASPIRWQTRQPAEPITKR